MEHLRATASIIIFNRVSKNVLQELHALNDVWTWAHND